MRLLDCSAKGEASVVRSCDSSVKGEAGVRLLGCSAKGEAAIWLHHCSTTERGGSRGCEGAEIQGRQQRGCTIAAQRKGAAVADAGVQRYKGGSSEGAPLQHNGKGRQLRMRGCRDTREAAARVQRYKGASSEGAPLQLMGVTEVRK